MRHGKGKGGRKEGMRASIEEEGEREGEGILGRGK